ncbi:hypothetical protein NP493_426g05031 [Ridgeia piscesae]|uniref:Uncharacterized protein n=1 Tax=Ridgeia piscesae TaxID=27915 RepID=A0AAD9L0I4_RIDPI|nr:hypothetical protein NP493_426g05031 [Ridgeia piscesae]
MFTVIKYCWRQALHQQRYILTYQMAECVFTTDVCRRIEPRTFDNLYIRLLHLTKCLCLFADIVYYMIYLSQDNLHDLNSCFLFYMPEHFVCASDLLYKEKVLQNKMTARNVTTHICIVSIQFYHKITMFL